MGGWPHTGAHRTSVHRRGEEGEGGREKEGEGEGEGGRRREREREGERETDNRWSADGTCPMTQPNVISKAALATYYNLVGGVSGSVGSTAQPFSA